MFPPDFLELNITTKTIIIPIPIRAHATNPRTLLLFESSYVTEVKALGEDMSSEVTSGRLKELVCSSVDVVLDAVLDEVLGVTLDAFEGVEVYCDVFLRSVC